MRKTIKSTIMTFPYGLESSSAGDLPEFPDSFKVKVNIEQTRRSDTMYARIEFMRDGKTISDQVYLHELEKFSEARRIMNGVPHSELSMFGGDIRWSWREQYTVYIFEHAIRSNIFEFMIFKVNSFISYAQKEILHGMRRYEGYDSGFGGEEFAVWLP